MVCLWTTVNLTITLDMLCEAFAEESEGFYKKKVDYSIIQFRVLIGLAPMGYQSLLNAHCEGDFVCFGQNCSNIKIKFFFVAWNCY